MIKKKLYLQMKSTLDTNGYLQVAGTSTFYT